MIKRGKKAQITLFIIVAVIIAAVILIFYFINSSQQQVQQKTSASVRNSVQGCIESTAKIGLEGMGLQAGYIVPPNETVSYEAIDIAYWYSFGKEKIPSLSVLETEFSNFLNENVAFCNNWSAFSDVNISSGNVSSRTKIVNDSVTIDIVWPITVTQKSGEIQKLEFFSKKFNIRLGRIYDAAKLIIAEQAKNPQSPCLSCMIDIISARGFTGELRFYNDSLIYTVYDAKSLLNDKIYEFKFAGKIK